MTTKYKVTKKPLTNPILKSWEALNEHIINSGQEECKKLLEEELRGRARTMFVFRIHSRLNKVRADEERQQLREKINEAAKASCHRLRNSGH